MRREPPQLWRVWLAETQSLGLAAALLATPVASGAAQDIRGMEVCTAEKQIERRTACLQANLEFLQQALMKLDRETREKIAEADRDLAAARAEIAALKSTVEKLNGELAQVKAKAQPEGKK